MPELVQQGQTQKEGDIEFDTRRFIGIIWRWKGLIFFMIAFFVTVASLYSYLAPKVYRTRTVIEASSIESPVTLTEIINHNFFNDRVAKKLNIEASILPKMIANNILGTNLVAVSVISKNADQAQQMLSALDEEVISDSAELFDARQKRLLLIKKKIEDISLEFEPITKQYLSDYPTSSKDATGSLSGALLLDGFLSFLEKGYENDVNFFDLKKRKIIIPSQVLRPPLWPRPFFIISFAAIVGFLFGIFIASWRDKRVIPT